MNNKNVSTKITNRYSELSANNCNLSCGNNIDFLELIKGEHVLDLGCGKGLESIECAKLVSPTGLVTGLDLTKSMIDNAVENQKKEGVSNINFVIGDIENLPFSDNSYDVVISNCVINHASSKLTVFKEIYRVLNTNGRFIISDATTKFPLPIEIKKDPRAWAECFGGAITEDEYIETVKCAGFSSIEVLKRREYLKNNFEFISLTLRSYKIWRGGDSMKKVTLKSSQKKSTKKFTTAQCCSKSSKVVAGCHD